MNAQHADIDLRPTSLGRPPFSSVPDVKKLRFPADDAGQRFPFVDGKYPAQEIREAYCVFFHDASPVDLDVEDPTSWSFEVEMDNDDEGYGPVGPVGHVTLLFSVTDPQQEDSLPDGVQDALYRGGGPGRKFVENYRSYWRQVQREANSKAAGHDEAPAPEQFGATEQVNLEGGSAAELVAGLSTVPVSLMEGAVHSAVPGSLRVEGGDVKMTSRDLGTLLDLAVRPAVAKAGPADMSVGRWLQEQHDLYHIDLDTLSQQFADELRSVDPDRRLSAVSITELTPERWRLALHCREPADLGRALTAHSVTITPALFGDCHMKVTGRRKYDYQRQTLEFIEATLRACLWLVVPQQ